MYNNAAKVLIDKYGHICIFSSISPRLKSRGHKYFINKSHTPYFRVTM